MPENERKRYVVGFLFDYQKTKVLLVKKNRPEAWVGKRTGPGGKIEGKETPVQAMRREFREETGLDIKEADWKHTVSLDTGDFTLDFFASFGVPNKARQMESEELEVCPIEQLPKTMFSNAHWAIPMSLDERMEFPVVLSYAGAKPVDPGAVSSKQTPAASTAATGGGAGAAGGKPGK